MEESKLTIFRLFIFYILITFCLVLPDKLVTAAETADQSYDIARKAYYALQDSSRKQMYRDQWLNVINRFADVYKTYPDSPRGADALFMWAKTTDGLYQISRLSGDAQDAVELYEQVASQYPSSSLADDALLRAGELLEQSLGKPAEAYLVYQRLISRHSGGDMVEKGRQQLSGLAEYAPKQNKNFNDNQKAALGKVLSKERQTTPPPTDGQTSLASIRYWSNPGYTRIVLDLSQPSAFSAHFLPEDNANGVPSRLYVDLDASAMAQSLTGSTAVNDGLLQRIRTGIPEPGKVRVVLDLKSVADYKVFPLVDPYRVVIDIAGEKVQELKSREPELRALPPADGDAIALVLPDQRKVQPPLHVPTSPASTTLRRIVVDAGHGGKDPGAIGPKGTYEKDITLALAKQLAKALRQQLDCEVILTRTADVYLPLEERTAIANKVGADLFISLHANASENHSAFGLETYYLNFSKNDKAAAVAARENGTTMQQVSDLELILFDLMANAKINESSRLAAEIQKSLVGTLSRKYAQIRDLGVRQGPFYVLLGATMPSVLVETAFISNPREEKRLKSNKYQEHTAQAIASAVKKYAIANKLIAAK
jgi:N-acetylmuramoyl-L-alanine amidase